MLKIKNLVKNYKDFNLDLSFEIKPGTIMGLIGENGAGKTTTINLILDNISRDSGEITVFGLDNKKDGVAIKENLGVVLDDSFLHDGYNIKQITKILGSIYNNWDDELFKSYIERFSLPVLKSIKEYSRGMKTKLQIAIALSHHPKLLILDEPTSGLDPIVRNEILDIFLEFMESGENAILFSTHITTDLEKIADYITFVHKGKLVFSENKDELIYGMGIAKGDISEIKNIPEKNVLKVVENKFDCQALVKDKSKIENMIVDSATLEDIMLFYVKGEDKLC